MSHSALLLAGGRSTRMGVDKAQLIVEGQPLWSRQLAILRATAPDDVFISGPLQGAYAKSGVPILADAIEGCGPLAGLAEGLAACRSAWLLVLAVDLPQMTSGLLQELVALAEPSGCGVVPMDAAGRWEPLVAVYPAGARTVASQLLEAGHRRLSDFIEALERTAQIARWPIPPWAEPQFINWNTPADLGAHMPPR